MQKLFSMFPSGAPGCALLLLRLFVAAVWVSDALSAGPGLNAVFAAVLAASALAVVVGFATPIAAFVAALIEAVGLNVHSAHIPLSSFGPVVVGVALALLGPGAFSIDARVFGRRLLAFGPDAKDRE